MTSVRQVEANRRNAARSTGPRSTEGKAVAALNGVRHGPLSAATLLPGEREADLVEFGRKVRAALAPVGEMELLLADRIVTAGWRLRRLLGVEALLLRGAGEASRNAFDFNGGRKMLALARYEGGIERGLYKALHELQRLQAARQGAVVPVPQVVDAIISGDGVESGDEGEVIGFVPSYPGTEIRAPGTTTRESKT